MTPDYHPLKIDELLIHDHFYLDPTDKCYFFMEYTSRAGFGFSKANDLIQNFKKPVDRMGKDEYRYKLDAIFQISGLLTNMSNLLQNWVVVPIPPSKTKEHELYDDRLMLCLQKAWGGKVDIRELLILTENMQSAHESQRRPSIEEISEKLKVDQSLCDRVPDNIVLFDDVLTTGVHFKAAKRALTSKFSNAEIVGVFIARRCFHHNG